MESRIANISSSAVLGLGANRKTKSLNLHSIYKARVSKGNLPKTKKLAVQNGGEAPDDSSRKKKRKKRKKSGKEVALDSQEPVSKKKRKNLDEGHANDPRSGLVSADSGLSLSGLSHRNGLNGLSLSFGASGNVLHIPRRRRGLVGRKKSVGNGSVKPSGPSSSVYQGANLNGELGKVESSGSSSGEVCSDDNPPKSRSGSGGKVGVSKVTTGDVGSDDKPAKLRSGSGGKVGGSKASNGEVGSDDKLSKSRSGSGGKVGGSKVLTGDGGSNHKLSKSQSGSGAEVGGSKAPSGAVGSDDKIRNSKLLSVLGIKVAGSKAKRKRIIGEAKESEDSRSSSSRRAKEDDGHQIVNNGIRSPRKRPRNRKRIDLASHSETTLKKVEHSVDNSISIFDDFQNDDDDEEKLEQNAARMLSSRFDPRCMGFTSKSRTSGRLSGNSISFPRSSRRGFSLSGLKSKDASRVLRPRIELKETGLPRKRRHFYEIAATNLDAFWFLNRRIKVFWPLDESWYVGLVNDYNPEVKLHHVKYDDRDEEWIDLHNEKFKLLLLPSEVPRKGETKSPMPEQYMGRKKTDSKDDCSFEGSYLDSEPIISWLSRSSRRVKSSPSEDLKKQKTTQQSPSMVATVLSSGTDDRVGDVGSSVHVHKSDYDSTLPDTSADFERAQNSLLGNTSSSKSCKHVVYVRRHLNMRQQGDASENDKSRIWPLKNFTSFAPVVDSLLFWDEYGSSFGCLEFDELFWSADDLGLLRLRAPLGELSIFRLSMCLTVLPSLDCSVLTDHFGLFRTLLLLHYGTIVTVWPEVALDMLFVDNVIGVRFLRFEGCLKLAVELFCLILAVFNRSPGEWKFFDMELPITSVSFKLSSTQDLRRQQEFTFYTFSKMRQSKWLYLDSKLQQHCLLSKKLPISECTYDNIKALERGNCQLDAPCVGPGFSPIKKRLVSSILPVGISRELSSNMTTHSAVDLGQIPKFALSFAAAPSFFLSLHLKLLVERNFACISLQTGSSHCSIENPVVSITPTSAHSLQDGSFPENVPVGDLNSEEGDGHRAEAAEDPDYGKSGTIVGSSNKDFEMAATDDAVHPKKLESHNQESEEFVASPVASLPKTVVCPGLSNEKSCSSLGGLSIELPLTDHIDKPLDGRGNISRQISDLAGNTSDSVFKSLYRNSLRSAWRSDRNDSSSPFGDASPIWPEKKSVFIGNGFGSGPKKPRTRVRYPLPAGGYDYNLRCKSQNQRAFPYKRIRRSNEKRISDGLISSQKDLELLSCDANVLVTLGDKGWREYGARIVLELADQNDWRLAVKVSGVTKYSYKVDHVLQPGSTNRFTHAMMWKGGKDWALEFPGRNQWVIFKEMHEECHNRNIRAASVKNIPIPGVRLIEESDDYAAYIPFIRNPSMYFRQVESDVDMAMDPSHILYDMDSDDEDWILKNGKSLFSGENKFQEISLELFDKMIDILEKFAYSQQRDQFSVDELEELMVGIDSLELVKGVYEHWRQKRLRKGMPLIRHLQPPLWERYEQQVKEWEQAVARASAVSSTGCKEKTLLPEKPAMFAFCLKPRRLEVPNKGSKQRSQKKFPLSGYIQAASGDQDGFHPFVPGRRLNGFSAGEEKCVFSGNSHEFSDSSPSMQASARVFSPRDAGFFSLGSDLPDWNHHPRYHWNKAKKNGTFSSPSRTKLVPYPQRTIGMRNGVHRWNMDLPEWPSEKHRISEGYLRHEIDLLDDSDRREFRLRDASGAALHALNMAKLKRERAQRLLYRADLAIHKAVVALMTAEAKKDACDRFTGDD